VSSRRYSHTPCSCARAAAAATAATSGAPELPAYACLVANPLTLGDGDVEMQVGHPAPSATKTFAGLVRPSRQLRKGATGEKLCVSAGHICEVLTLLCAVLYPGKLGLSAGFTVVPGAHIGQRLSSHSSAQSYSAQGDVRVGERYHGCLQQRTAAGFGLLPRDDREPG
jgi:hypothetical protein